MPDVVGFEAHKQYIMSATQAIPNSKQEWRYLAGEGNLFALSYKASGRITGEMPGFPLPVGKDMFNDDLFVVRLNKGKIVEVWINGSMAIK